MDSKLLYATFLLYIMIFIEQTLESDSFSQEEEYAITGVVVYAFLAVWAMKDESDVSDKDIKNMFPDQYASLIKETLSDVTILTKDTVDSLKDGFETLAVFGEIIFLEIEEFIDPTNLKKNILEYKENVFSISMFAYETAMLLDQYHYDMREVLSVLTEEEPDQEMVIAYLNKIGYALA